MDLKQIQKYFNEYKKDYGWIAILALLVLFLAFAGNGRYFKGFIADDAVRICPMGMFYVDGGCSCPDEKIYSEMAGSCVNN